MTARKMASNLDANGRRILNLPSPAAASTEPARQIDLETARSFAISRANHSGTQLASTISNFVATVQTVALNTLAVPSGPVAFNAQRATGLADPTSAQDAATKNYVDNTVNGLIAGQTAKGSVRVLAKTNVTISAPGNTIDGVTMALNDIALLTQQTTGSEGGPWVYNGPSAPMTRPSNWNSASRAVVGSYWIVNEGTSADTIALMTNDSAAWTFGTTTPTWKVVDIAAAAAPPFEVDLGDGAATSFTLTHNLNTRNVHVQIRRNASPFEAIHEFTYYDFPSLNTILVAPDEVWSTAQFHLVVAKM